MANLLDAMKVGGNEKFATAAFSRIMKLNRNYIEESLQDGEITKSQRDSMNKELNEINSVADEMIKLSPTVPTILHKFVNNYRQAVVQNYIVQSLTKPKVNNSLVARMRPYDKWLQKTHGELRGKNDELFYDCHMCLIKITSFYMILI